MAQHGVKNRFRRKPRSEAVLGPSWAPFWALPGGPGRAQIEPETAPKTGAKFKQFWGLPWDPPGREVLPPRDADEVLFGARGETTEGGT